MTSVTQPLRAEHQQLLPHIEQLRVVADMAGTVPLADLRRHIDDVYAFLSEQLIPHAAAEDAALYPVVGHLLGAPQATATMSRDHAEVGRLTNELAALRATLHEHDDKALRELRRVLYGLYALLTVHFAKEEEIYLPLLDRQLTATEAQRMFAAMEQAAAEAKHRAAQ